MARAIAALTMYVAIVGGAFGGLWVGAHHYDGGRTFTMVDGGPVPAGCCEPGDTLNVVGVTLAECDHMGGRFDGAVCADVDF